MPRSMVSNDVAAARRGRPVLRRSRQARLARRLGHVHDDRLGRRLRVRVAAEAHREVEAGRGVPHPRRRHAVDLELLERRPVADEHVGVDERHLDRVAQRRHLRLGQLGADVRDHVVPAGEHHRLARTLCSVPPRRYVHLDAVGRRRPARRAPRARPCCSSGCAPATPASSSFA